MKTRERAIREKRTKNSDPHPDCVIEGGKGPRLSLGPGALSVFRKEVKIMAKNNNKNGKATLMAQVIAGARKHFPNGAETLKLEGASTTIDAVLKELQGFVDARNAIVAAQMAARNMVAAERAGLPAMTALLAAFIAFIRNAFGPTADVLADFGVPVRKVPVPKTAEQKAVAAAKRKATRAARGTKGPKAKLAVHGDITAQLVVTPAGSAAGAPTAPATAPEAAPGGTPATPPKA
jgi:hypothetical protein